MTKKKHFFFFKKIDTSKSDRDAYIKEINDAYEASMNNGVAEKATFNALLKKYPYRAKIPTQKKVLFSRITL